MNLDLIRIDIAHHAERTLLAFVWRLPRKLVYWCAIRLMAHATTGQYGADEVHSVSIMDALERW